MARNSTSAEPLPFVDPDEVDKWAVFHQIGYVPDEWQRVFHAAPQKYRMLASGVRVGKTFAATAEAVAAAITPSKKSREVQEWVGARIWLCAPTYDLTDRMFLPTLRHLKRHFPFLIESSSERERIIRLIGGGIIQGKSTENKDSLVGEELDAAIIDEAARVGEDAKEMIRQRLITRNGWMVSISSPTSVKWFMREFELGQANGFHYEWEGDALPGCTYAGRRVKYVRNPPLDDPDAKQYFSIRIPTHANSRLDAEELALWERKMPERLFRQDILAEFVGNSGLVFRGFEQRLLPREGNERYRGDKNRLYVVAWDPARTTDWSVVTVWDVLSRQQVFLDRFHGDWETQYARVIKLCRRYNAPYLAVDATGKGDAVCARMEELNLDAGRAGGEGKFARDIVGITTYTNKEKRNLVEAFQAGLEHDECRLLDYPEQTQEMRLFEYTESETTKVVRYSAPKGFHDDTVMANCMAFRVVDEPQGTTAFIMG